MKELFKIRKEIDKIDTDLLNLLVKRKKLTIEIGGYKLKNNLEVIQPAREKGMIAKRLALAKEYDLDDELIKKIFQAIIDNAVKIQKSMR